MNTAVSADLLQRFRIETTGYHWEVGLFAALVGGVLLCFGWNLYRACIVLSGIICGVAGGTLVAGLLEISPRYPALAGGLLLGVMAVPLVKMAVLISSGTAGAVVAYGWAMPSERLTDLNKGSIVLAAFIVCALLSLVMFRLMVTFTFSVQGAVLICGGVLINCQQRFGPVADWLYAHPVAVWGPFYLLFFVGIVTQLSENRRLTVRKEEKVQARKARAKVRKKYGRPTP